MNSDTGIVVAHPWHCDVMGHMNARHIYAAFDDAAFVLLDYLGFATLGSAHQGNGWADVRTVIEFTHEVPSGTVMRVRSNVVRLGRTSFTHRHDLVSGTDVRHATAEITTVRFDLVMRKAVVLPETFAEAANSWLIE